MGYTKPVVTYRPLGQATAWLGYRLSGGTIYPIELFNYLLAAVSWFILFLAIKEKNIQFYIPNSWGIFLLISSTGQALHKIVSHAKAGAGIYSLKTIDIQADNA